MSEQTTRERIWVRNQPGELCLAGTEFAVRYEPGRSRGGEYRLYQGERRMGAFQNIYHACQEAEARQDDIDLIMGEM